jgi:hypothetical protein
MENTINAMEISKTKIIVIDNSGTVGIGLESEVEVGEAVG